MHIVKFEQRMGRKTKQVSDYVLLAPADDVTRTQSWHKVEDLIPPSDGLDQDRDPMGTKIDVLRGRWALIEPAYRAWKEGTEIPETGTPLMAWPSLDTFQIDAFRKAGIKTVEDLRDAGDSIISKVNIPSARALRTQAGMFLENQGAAEATERMEAQEAQIKALQEQLNAMAPKRGRPRKEVADA